MEYIIYTLCLSFAISLLLLTIAYAFSVKIHANAETLSEYECGFNVFDSATKLPFDVQFYIVGLLFLIFDLEVALMFPWVLSFPYVENFEYWTMMLFVTILTAGFGYEWYVGILSWPTR